MQKWQTWRSNPQQHMHGAVREERRGRASFRSCCCPHHHGAHLQHHLHRFGVAPRSSRLFAWARRRAALMVSRVFNGGRVDNEKKKLSMRFTTGGDALTALVAYQTAGGIIARHFTGGRHRIRVWRQRRH